MQQNLCEAVRMRNIDTDAKAWELDLSSRFGRAVFARRKALGLSAVQLAARTDDLGYPITRVTISKIENNARAGKVDVAELLVLAAALDVPPVLLVFPDYPYGAVFPLPGLAASSLTATEWVSGDAVLPPQTDRDGVARNRPSNPGVELVRHVNSWYELSRLIHNFADAHRSTTPVKEIRAMTAHYEADRMTAHLATAEARSELWGDAPFLLGDYVE